MYSNEHQYTYEAENSLPDDDEMYDEVLDDDMYDNEEEEEEEEEPSSNNKIYQRGEFQQRVEKGNYQHSSNQHLQSLPSRTNPALTSSSPPPITTVNNTNTLPSVAADNYERRLVNSGILAAFESAMMDAASKKVGAGDLMVFLAKQIEQFGRQWNAGYIDKRRFRKGFRAAKDQAKEEQEQELEDRQSTFAPTRPEGAKRAGTRPPNGRLMMEPGGNHHDRAATKLQAIQRGRVTRTKASHQHTSANHLQRHYRGYSARIQMNNRHEAAAKLQAIHRGRALRIERTQQHVSANHLQRHYRGYTIRRNVREKEAIVIAERHSDASSKIQALHRGRAARREMEYMRMMNEFSGQDNISAAEKVQAMHRGRAARREVEYMKMMNEFSGEDSISAAEKVQAMHRGRIARREVEYMKMMNEFSGEDSVSAAEKVQAMHRGRIARREVEYMKMMNEFSGEDSISAAEKVQAMHRGRIARREVEFMKMTQEFSGEDSISAAEKVQAMHRGRIARREVEFMKMTNEFSGEDNISAAEKVQAMQRGRIARREVEEMKLAKLKFLEEVQHIIVDRDIHIGSPVETTYGKGYITVLPRKKDRMTQVELTKWKLANGTSPTMYCLPDLLVAKRRVRTPMGKGWIVHVRSDGFYSVSLDWTLAGGKRARIICKEIKLEFIETEELFPEDIICHGGTVQEREALIEQALIKEQKIISETLKHDKEAMHKHLLARKNSLQAIHRQHEHKYFSVSSMVTTDYIAGTASRVSNKKEEQSFEEQLNEKTANEITERSQKSVDVKKKKLKVAEDKADKRVQQRLRLRKRAKTQNVLKNAPAFANLTVKAQGIIVDCMTYSKFDKDIFMCKQGEQAVGMYLLMKGTCKVMVDEKEVATLKEYDVFGESTLFGKGLIDDPDTIDIDETDASRLCTASVVANEDIEVLVLTKIELNKLMKSGDLSQQCVADLAKVAEERKTSNISVS